MFTNISNIKACNNRKLQSSASQRMNVPFKKKEKERQVIK